MMTKQEMLKPLVLVVDDEPNNLDIVSEVLGDGYEVLTAENGDDGLAVIKKRVPDLVILDLCMPGMDGFEVCRRLKREAITQDTLVLVISALAQREDKLEAYAAGCDDYMTKPFEIRELRAKVKAMLQLKVARELRLQRLIDLMPHGITMRDEHGRLLLVNTAFAEFYGQKKDELVGKSIREVVGDAAVVEQILQRDREALESQAGLEEVVERVVDAHGQPHSLQITKTRFINSAGPAVLTVSTDITTQKQIERELRENEQRLAEAERLAGIANWEWHPETGEAHWSDNFYRLLGITREELRVPSFENARDFFPPGDLALVQSAMLKAMETGGLYDLEHCLIRRDGSQIEVHCKGQVVRDEAGQALCLRGTVQNVTDRKQQETRDQLVALMFQQLSEAVIITDQDKHILYVNEAFCQITGFSEEEVIGKKPSIVRSQHHGDDFYRNLWLHLNERGEWQGEVWNRRKNGSLYPSWLSISCLKNPQGAVTHYVGISRDLSEDKEAQERLHYLSNHDIQTGLPNRSLLLNELTEALELSSAQQQQVAFVAVRINDFQLVNEGVGYLNGDRYISELACSLRGLALWKDAVGRLNTTTLGLIIPQLQSPNEALPVLKQVLDLNNRVLSVGEREMPVSLNLGVSLYPDDGLNAEDLLERAMQALAQAQRQGRGHFQYYTAGINSLVHTRLQVQAELLKANPQEAFFLQYQPKLDCLTGQLVGSEALLRWQHPQKGLIPPGEFIPIAEECGYIGELGSWVLVEACRRLQAWLQTGLNRYPVAVNVSVIQLQSENFTAQVKEALALHQVPPEMLELEITESALMSNPELAISVLEELKQVGVQLSLDDFGTGHSSLQYLSRLPVDKLKIDRSFVQRCMHQAEDALIIRTIISMAKGMGIKVVAEGVETAEQYAFLKRLGCDQMQGYYLSKPLSVGDFEQYIQGFTGLDEAKLSDHRQRTLLLVDDEPNVISSLKRLLRREGYRLLTATTVAEAKAILAAEQVEVVVCDQRMPEMRGSEFFSQLKYLYPSVVRIILSGYTDFSAISHAINEGGIYKYITKPWEDDELRAALTSAFDKYDIES